MTREEAITELKFLVSRSVRQSGIFAAHDQTISPSDVTLDVVSAILNDARCRDLMRMLIDTADLEQHPRRC